MTQTSASEAIKYSNMASETPNVGYVLEAFRKLSIESNDVVHLKDEQEKAVNCLLDGRDVLAVMPTGYGKSFIFQLFATAMAVKKVHEGHHSDTVVLVVCHLTSIIQDQVKEGNSLGLDCAALKDCKDLSSVVSGTTRVVFASAEEVLHNDFQRILKNRNSKFHEALELLVVDESHTVETWTGKRFVMIFDVQYVC